MKLSFKQALDSGPLLGMFYCYPAPGIIERIGADWDWVWICGQHGELDYQDIMAAVRACELVDRYSVVRVPSHEAGRIGMVLDTAADAVVVPMVDTAEQAARLVQAAKFPPLGGRSFGGRRVVDRNGRGYAHADRPQPALICQIETRTALGNVEAIAAVPGVDALLFGPDDMALADGLVMDQPRPDGYFDDVFKTIADTARKHGLIAGSVFTSANDLQKALGWGYRLIVGSSDVGLLAAGSKAQSQLLKQCLRQST
jgi:4-hydroxy-2-oxoheptanedioate aldolase